MRKVLPILAMIVGLTILGCSQKSIVNVNTTHCNYSKIEVYFYYSPYCPHCEKVKPYVDQVREKYKNVTFIYCNVSDKNVSKECYTYSYYVVGIPTVVVHADGVTTALVGEKDVMGLEKVIRGLACCGS